MAPYTSLASRRWQVFAGIDMTASHDLLLIFDANSGPVQRTTRPSVQDAQFVKCTADISGITGPLTGGPSPTGGAFLATLCTDGWHGSLKVTVNNDDSSSAQGQSSLGTSSASAPPPRS